MEAVAWTNQTNNQSLRYYRHPKHITNLLEMNSEIPPLIQHKWREYLNSGTTNKIHIQYENPN